MKSKPRILALFDYFYPAVRSGGPARSSLGFAEAFCGHFDVTVLTSNHDFGVPHPLPGIVPNRPVEMKGFTVYYLDKSARRQIIREWIQRSPEFIYINSFFSFDFSIYPQCVISVLRPKSKMVLAPRGELAPTALSGKAWKKKLFLMFYKLALQRPATLYQASSEFEQRDIHAVLSTPNVHVAANLRPVSDLHQQQVSSVKKVRGSVRACLIARIHPIKNVLMAIDVVLKAKDIDIWLDVYGFAEDRDYYQQCLQKAQLSHGTVRLCPPLSADEVVKVLGHYHLLFLPTQGENFGHSILESFIAGRPVLISNATPWRNLAGKNAGFDEPLDEAVLISRLIFFAALDQQEFDIWCKGARQLAVEFFDRQATLRDYQKLFSN